MQDWQKQATDPVNIAIDFLILFSFISHYLRVIEIQEQTCVRGFLEPATLRASEMIRKAFFKKALHYRGDSYASSELAPLALGFSQNYWKGHILRRNDRPEIQMLVFYALNDLHLSFKESILSHQDDLREEDIRCIRQAALTAKPESNLALSTAEIWKDYIPEMPPNRTRMRSKSMNETGCDTQQP